MKNFFVLLAFFLLSHVAQATNKDSSYLFWYEGSVFATSTGSLRLETLPKGYKDIPSYFQDYDENSFVSEYYIQDSFVREVSYMVYPSSSVDYRNATLGVSKNIKKWKRFSLDHAVGINYSKADFKYFDRLKEYSSYSTLTYDTLGRDSTAFVINKYIEGYKKVRRIGLLYQNSFSTNQSKRFSLAAVLRHSVHVTFTDNLYLNEYRHSNQLTYYYDHVDYIDEYGFNFNLRGLAPYNKEKPTKDFSEHKRKSSFQYDAMFIIQPTVHWGPYRKLGTYISLGKSVGMRYGNDYSTLKGGVFYGFGIGYRL
jgi:hypothetical protein